MTDQERLADIKKSFGGRWTHLDIKWLIEQAEKVEQLQQDIKEWERISDKQVEYLTRNGKKIIELTDEISRLETELMMLR
jgi:predicted SpoU family rRNA methylase